MEFEVGGIFYEVNKDEKTVSVISNYYEGELAIPDSVEYNGNEYSVTAIGCWAFRDSCGLTSVVIPDSVTWIGDSGGIVYTLVKSSNARYTVGVHHGRSEDGQLAIYSKADNVLNTLGVERY